MFIQNLRSKDIAARASGKRRPLFEGHLLDRDIHISEIEIPKDSLWAGKTLAQLNLAKRFGVHVSSIQRGRRNIHIPSGGDMLFPGDKLRVIGTDEQFTILNSFIQKEQYGEDINIEQHEMQLRRFVIRKDSILLGKSLITSSLRDTYNCMLVGLEEGEENLSTVEPTYKFEIGDILWIVGNEDDIYRLSLLI